MIPGKNFFQSLVAKWVKEVNAQDDTNGLTCTKKATILTDMAKNVSKDRWDLSKLIRRLQAVISKHCAIFYGSRLAKNPAGVSLNRVINSFSNRTLFKVSI